MVPDRAARSLLKAARPQDRAPVDKQHIQLTLARDPWPARQPAGRATATTRPPGNGVLAGLKLANGWRLEARPKRWQMPLRHLGGFEPEGLFALVRAGVIHSWSGMPYPQDTPTPRCR